MTVRRLAEETVQPAKFAFTKENQQWAANRVALYPEGRQQSAVISLLWRAQEQEGWVTRAAIEAVATMLGMAYIRVLEVATFYTQFLLKPPGTRAHILVCGTTPCMLRGAEDLREVCQHRINPQPFETNEAGTLSWEEVECLGACVNAPMVMIGNDTFEDLTVERFEEIIDSFEAGKGETVVPGPQIPRVFSAAEGGATTLLEEPTATRTYKAFPPPEPAPGAEATKAAPIGIPTTDAPTKPGRKRDIPAESAPALKEPKGAKKVSEATAEAARSKTDSAATASGSSKNAGSKGAVGSEAVASKTNGGKRASKATPAAKAASTGTTDAPLFTAPSGVRDDLKLISGVGPVLEKTLNSQGITTFAQVAALKKAEIVALEDRLQFKGRMERDDWQKQAKALAKGGEAEYIRVFGKKPR